MKFVYLALLTLVSVGCTKEVPVEAKVVELAVTIPPEVLQVKKGKAKVPTVATCSGAFISGSGHILTAKHCVDTPNPEVIVRTYDNRIYRAAVLAKSPFQDLALLQISRVNTPYFTLATRVSRGERVIVLGSPLGITNTLAEGVVAKIGGDEVLIDCSLLPGNSGGPVMNSNKELIGIGVAGYRVGSGVTHLNIMQSLSSIRAFLSKELPKE